MKKVRFTEEQMVAILREADRSPVVDVARKHKVSEQTIYVWRRRFGTLQPADVKRLRELEAENAKLKDRQALALWRVNADTVNAFCSALKERFSDPTSGLGKAYLRLLVDEIRLDGNDLVVTGSHRRLADAIGFMRKRKLSEVPSFVNDWRARQESNL
jgi:putative transposase